MRIEFGRHKDEIVELVMLQDPGYIRWVLDQKNASWKLGDLQNEIARLMEIFDRKPILTRCAGPNCSRNATRAVVSRVDRDLSWWCDQCSPVQAPNEDKPIMICSYQHALNYVTRHTGRWESDYYDLIQALARAKGLGAQVGKDEAQEFLCPFPPENRFLERPTIRWEGLIF